MSARELTSLLTHLGEHLGLVIAALIPALAISVPLGVAVEASPKRNLILAALNTLYTIPSLALFALLIPLLGLGLPTAVSVLTLYASIFLTRSVTLALRDLDPSTLECAHALGATRKQTLLRVALPLAAPAVLTGLRGTCLILIATATIAAWIDAGGLGVLFFEGLRQDDMRRVVIGSIAAALLALCIDGALAYASRVVHRRLLADI